MVDKATMHDHQRPESCEHSQVKSRSVEHTDIITNKEVLMHHYSLHCTECLILTTDSL